MERQTTAHIALSRRVAESAAVLGAMAVQSEGSRRGISIHRPIYSWSTYVTGLRPAFFTRFYPMGKPTFFAVAEQLCVYYGNRRFRRCGLLRLSLTI